MAGDQLQAALISSAVTAEDALDVLDRVREKIKESNGTGAVISMDEIVAISPRLKEGPPAAVIDGRPTTMAEIKLRYDLGDYVVDGGDPRRGGVGAFWATNIQERPPAKPNSPIPQYALITSPQ